MHCNYCKNYMESLKRINHKKDEDSPKTVKRLCGIKKLWVEGSQDPCDSFIQCESFWCHRLRQQMFIKACINKRKIGTKTCKKCSQFLEVIEAVRMGTVKVSPKNKLNLRGAK